MDISLINVDPETRVVTFGLSNKPVTGINKLLQMVVLSLMNTPGQDLFDPDMGGGIPEMISMNFDPNDYSEVLAELTRRIKKTEKEVLYNQIGSTIESSEKLRELSIISVGPGASVGEIYAKIRIINEMGQHSDVVI